jgi:UDP-3-O-[3-hydroxymyristoyl] glucosamine N-acyltransferase
MVALRFPALPPLDNAQAGDISFVSGDANLAQARACAASALITSPQLARRDTFKERALLISENPKLAFARAIRLFNEPPIEPRGVSADLVLGEGSRLGQDCSIHPRVTLGRACVVGDRVTLHSGVVIGDRVTIGDDTVILANVSIYEDSQIGKGCRIHSGTVIGSDGFSFVPDEEGHQYKLLQIGRVVIEDDVEIGANCCVDRAGFGETRIAAAPNSTTLSRSGTTARSVKTPSSPRLPGFREVPASVVAASSRVRSGQISTSQSVTAQSSPRVRE